jgi:hypothetical protein
MTALRGKIQSPWGRFPVPASSSDYAHQNGAETFNLRAAPDGMTRALWTFDMPRLLHRLASLLVVVSVVGATAQTLCASSLAVEPPVMPCSDGGQTSLICCCEATAPASTVPPVATVTATLIADQASAHITALSVPDRGVSVPNLDRGGTHRAGPPVRLTILHASLLL